MRAFQGTRASIWARNRSLLVRFPRGGPLVITESKLLAVHEP